MDYNELKFQGTAERLAAQYEPCLRDLERLVEQARRKPSLRPQERINLGGIYKILESPELNTDLLVQAIKSLRESVDRHYRAKGLEKEVNILDRATRLINQTARSKICKDQLARGN